MHQGFRTSYHTKDINHGSATFPALFQLPRPLLDYNLVIALVKGDVGAINILRDAMKISKGLRIENLLALGPTAPITLQPPSDSKILWATFTDGQNLPNGFRLTVVPPNQLTDLSLNLEKLSKTRTGRIPLIIGDFLDNVLSVSSAPGELYSFLCKLFTRIRTNRQTAFFLVTEDMHDSKKTAILKRFADAVIEYQAVQEQDKHRFEARILDHLENQYSRWDSSDIRHSEHERYPFLGNQFPKVGRQPGIVSNPIPA
jgi:hypothetical protein